MSDEEEQEDSDLEEVIDYFTDESGQRWAHVRKSGARGVLTVRASTVKEPDPIWKKVHDQKKGS
jgi:hypothetical protein